MPDLALRADFVKTPTQLQLNSTQPQPNITLFRLDMKMTLHIPPSTEPNVIDISAAIDPILMKL